MPVQGLSLKPRATSSILYRTVITEQELRAEEDLCESKQPGSVVLLCGWHSAAAKPWDLFIQ